MMPSENVIHIKLDYMEALKARRSILSSELGSLNIAKKIARYREIRMEELGLKARLYGKMKEAKSSIKKLQSLLPNPKMPRIMKREQVMEEHLGKTKSTTREQGDIESQLREIQRRLAELQRQKI
ncbi:MAG TPA: hypothetical protein VJ142_01620 [Candidatus Nanoarchaeia archaeon]|nr:hypothetical protein [Candidatus Nanoarchaeia archaeon]